jgi:glutathione-independent formaldehyde dehydrogenase
MRAVVYKAPFQVAVEDVPKPDMVHPNDVIVRVTSTCICGSDLHMYEGRTAAQPGIVFGHENLGVVEEVGSAVLAVHRGDRVVMPFNVACGFCKNCQAGFTGFCLTVNPGFAGGAYGYVAMGPYVGGQAEYLRVPFADFNCLILPPGPEHEADYALLADIFPTGYHGCELADVRPGESVSVYGAGPVGLMAAYSALLRGASRVFVVDRVAERLQKAREIGAIPIDFDQGDPAQQIREQTANEGTDKGVDAVGYQAVVQGGEREEPATVLNAIIDTVRPTGAIGIPGLYVPSDPGGVDEGAVREGAAPGHRPVQREALQPAAPGPDRGGAGHARLRRLPRAAAGRRAGRVREVRQADRGIHQGHPASVTAAPIGPAPPGAGPAAGGPVRDGR